MDGTLKQVTDELTRATRKFPTWPTVKLCRDCRHSMPEPKSEWNLQCMHPEVNARDSWALASVKPHGSKARDERDRKWTLRGLAPCGMRGALWAPKEDDGDITGKPRRY